MTRLLWLACLPFLYATQGPAATATSTDLSWRSVRASAVLDPALLAGREALPTPGLVARPGLASPTRVPWVQANGWRFIRNRGRKFSYDLPPGKGALGVAEALAYGADVVIKIDPADATRVETLFAIAKELPPADLPDVADFGVIDDGSPVTGEVMNLFVRRNLLFAPLTEPSTRFSLNVKIGTKEYPIEKAADPSAFALEIRRQLTDERRSLRLYGSEVVIARLTGDAGRARVHLLNYSNRELVGLRIRVRGEYTKADAFIPGQGRVPLADLSVTDGATELSMPTMQVSAVVDLTRK